MSQKEGWRAIPRVSRRAGNGTALSDLAFPDEVGELVQD
jgi:hypothetical protein